MKRTTLVVAPWLLACASAQAGVTVNVDDDTFEVGPGMLAYTEFELSGEPLAESLGLDLDILDPNAIDQPTAFDYTAGIESYEYSEEAMYAVNYQSRMGPHLANGPRNQARGGSLEDLGKRVIGLSQAVGYPTDEIPLNLYPISLPLRAGVPAFAGKVDTSVVNHDEVTTAGGETVQTDIPAYSRDFASLAWDPAQMDDQLSPAAIGGMLLKEVMWSQDFLGGMHTTDGDEETAARSADMDQDGTYALGVSSVDGFNGMLLTEISLDKMALLQNRLAYDGESLGAEVSPDYDPAEQPVWFPHRIDTRLVQQQGVNALGELSVADASSQLRDEWMLLWPLAEYYGFTDQRDANQSQNPAFLAVFDGQPFKATAEANRDDDTSNDVVGDDAFSLASNLAHLVFSNLDALHFDDEAGTLVDTWQDGERGQHVTTFDAAYSLVALDIYHRAQSAQPVGYASAEAAASEIETDLGERALTMLRRQADFLLANAFTDDGLVSDGLTLDGDAVTADDGQSLATQFAMLRGLGAAFAATKDAKYRDAGRKLYLAIDEQLYDDAVGTWATRPGEPTVHTPLSEAAISGGLRSAMLQFRNEGQENAAALELGPLTQRYVSWFRTVHNGPSLDGGMQLAEWGTDTGEHVIPGKGGDTDDDHVPQVTAAGDGNGMAAVMAAKATVAAD
ncbi:hypothetical protein [Modicisalibacter coralii]|uniref:hypothetical protein n=1 Tax=Modicisalibacter coralii TaxID=2304602 RepID=UPI00100A281B|nr:hypothetical protein [Halomonas coralii]